MRSEKSEKIVTIALALTFTSMVSKKKNHSENLSKFDQTGRKIESRLCISRKLQYISFKEMEAKGVVF